MVDMKHDAKHILWCIYDMARLYLDEDYIITGLLEMLEPDNVLTEEVINRLQTDPVYLSKIPRCFRDNLMDKISCYDEIESLLFAIKYCAYEKKEDK